jgi:hypothetical protein
VAFAVDIGWIVKTHEELQNAADSAAMAGAGKLEDYEVMSTFTTTPATLKTTASSAAVNEAQKFGQKNTGGGITLVLNTSDISTGYIASPSWGSTYQTNSSNFPNSVQVVVRRDSTVSTKALPLFFAPILGVSTADVTATATATTWGGSKVIGFKGAHNGPQSLLLPIALDVNAWNALLNKTAMPAGYSTQDNWTVVRPTSSVSWPSNVTPGGDNIPELVGIYPNKNAPGNFGLIDIGPDNNGAPAFWNWITNGPSGDDLIYLAANRNGVSGSSTFQASPANPATLKCGPGLKASDESYLTGIFGEPRIMPIFSSVQGNGQNATYTIVGFAGITLVEAQLTGNSKHITIQPLAALDDTAAVNQTSGSSTFVYGPGSLSLTR